MPRKYDRQGEGDVEAGTVQLTTTTDSIEHWPETGDSKAAAGRSTRSATAQETGPGRNVDFAKARRRLLLTVCTCACLLTRRLRADSYGRGDVHT